MFENCNVIVTSKLIHLFEYKIIFLRSDNKYISEFLYSEPTKKIGQVFHASLSGLFTVTQLEKLISETR